MLLDTNVLIYAARGEHEHLYDFILHDENACVSAVSRVETLGYPQLTPADETVFEALFREIPVLPIDDPVIDEAIRLRRIKRMSLGDSLIAATALCHDLPLATRNTADFAWIDALEVYNPVDRA